jgi:predicted PurR-regulated permease PerM
MTFYLAVYDNTMKKSTRALFPAQYQPYFMHLVNRMQDKIGLWLRGQLLLSFIIFIMCLLGLSIFGVKYAWVLALFAGIVEIIPYLGPFIGAVPAVFIAFTQSPELGVIVLVLYILIQQLENYLIVPLVMKKAVGLNPVVVIIAMMVGSQVAGIPGIILAVPVTTALGVIVGDILKHREGEPLESEN